MSDFVFALPRYWADFKKSVEEQNAFLQPLILRRYQFELLEKGEFFVISPYSGKRIATRASASGINGQIAYFFADQRDFWLLTPASQFKLGHPLTEAITEEGMKRFFIFSRKRAPETVSDAQLRLLQTTGRWGANNWSGSAALVIGHPNFAHHVWNELPALHYWLRIASTESLRRTRFVATTEPLGPLREIFPRLTEISVEATKPAGRIPLRVRMGSQIVSRDLRDTITDYFHARFSTPRVGEVLKALNAGWPRVWISIREGDRTPDNQFEFLLSVLRGIVKCYPQATFVVDGFSFPADFKFLRNLPLRNAYFERAGSAQRFIERLFFRASEKLDGDFAKRLCSVSGFDVREAIVVAGCCDYYVCHGGTLQHKVGWFHAKPGLIHAPLPGMAHFEKQAMQSELAMLPDMLPERFVGSTELSADAHNVVDLPRDANYRILDVPQAVEAILASMHRRLCYPDSTNRERNDL